MEDVLTLSCISKAFGKNKVLDNLSFFVPPHTVFGFIGPNGAGKTTTMKIILGLLKPDSGEVFVSGRQVRFGHNDTNQEIGYLPDVPEFYGFMTPREYLSLCGRVAGMPGKECNERADRLLSMVGLEQADKRIRGFSRGMKQRLGIAQALLGSPKLLICDEPTSALDPAGRKEILEILSAVKEDTTVLFSTHILSDVERICDEIAFLNNGKIALLGTLEEVRRMHGSKGFEVEFYRPKDAEWLAARYPGGRRASGVKLCYDRGTEQEMMMVMKTLAQNNMGILRLEMQEPALEDLFMEVIHE